MIDSYSWQYILVGLLCVSAILIAAAPIVIAKLIAPKKPSAAKRAPYECGLESSGDSWVQFRAQYYIYALLFVIFDVEVVFIYPWALVCKSLGPVILAEMFLFIAILGVALAYAWKKGVLEWE